MTSEARILAEAIRDVFESPNEADRNMENANVVDGLFFIGRALSRLAEVAEEANKIKLRLGR